MQIQPITFISASFTAGVHVIHGILQSFDLFLTERIIFNRRLDFSSFPGFKRRCIPGSGHRGFRCFNCRWRQYLFLADFIDPDALDAVDAAPLLCAGITTFNALRNAEADPGDLVAVQGIGGLGHLGIQYAHAMGFETVALSRSPDKEDLARDLGAFVGRYRLSRLVLVDQFGWSPHIEAAAVLTRGGGDGAGSDG